MDPASNHFIPPLLASLPTGRVTIGYAGANVHWQPPERILPVRSATEGHLSIYGDRETSFSRVVVAISFEEDDLPSLNRQVYYHYLEAPDSFTMTDNQVEFVFNNFPAVLPDNEEYKKTITWRIHFAPGVLDTVRSLLEKINLCGRWRNLAPISSLPADERAVLYYNLRSALIEQPIPERLGALGHWQNRLPGGTPSHLAYLEDRYRAKNKELEKWAQQDAAQMQERLRKIEADDQAARDVLVVPGQPDWGMEQQARGLASPAQSGSPIAEMEGCTPKAARTSSGFGAAGKKEEDSMMELDDTEKKPAAAKELDGMLSPPSSNDASPKGAATTTITSKQQMTNGTKIATAMNGGFTGSTSKVGLGTPYAASINLDHMQWEGTTQSPSLGSPALAIRRNNAFQGERRVSMNAVALLEGGKRANVQIVMPEDTVRQLNASSHLRGGSPFEADAMSSVNGEEHDEEGRRAGVV